MAQQPPRDPFDEEDPPLDQEDVADEWTGDSDEDTGAYADDDANEAVEETEEPADEFGDSDYEGDLAGAEDSYDDSDTPVQEPKRGLKKSDLIFYGLAGVIFLAIGFLVYSNFIASPEAPSAPAPQLVAETPSPQQQQPTEQPLAVDPDAQQVLDGGGLSTLGTLEEAPLPVQEPAAPQQPVVGYPPVAQPQPQQQAAAPQQLQPQPAVGYPPVTPPQPQQEQAQAQIQPPQPAQQQPEPVQQPVEPQPAPVQEAAPQHSAADPQLNSRLDELGVRLAELNARIDGMTQEMQNIKTAQESLASQTGAPATKIDPAALAPVTNAISRLEKQMNQLAIRPLSSSSPAVRDAALEAASRATGGKSTSSKSSKGNPKSRPSTATADPVISPGVAPQDWVLRAAIPGSAWISTKQNPTALRRVNVGDYVEGYGDVVSVRQVGGKWVVEGSEGVLR